MCLLRRYCRHAWLSYILKLKLIVTTPPPPKVCSCRKWIEISHNNEILQAARKMFRPCKNLIPSLLTANVREIPKSILVNVSVFRIGHWRLLQKCAQVCLTPLPRVGLNPLSEVGLNHNFPSKQGAHTEIYAPCNEIFIVMPGVWATQIQQPCCWLLKLVFFLQRNLSGARPTREH